MVRVVLLADVGVELAQLGRRTQEGPGDAGLEGGLCLESCLSLLFMFLSPTTTTTTFPSHWSRNQLTCRRPEPGPPHPLLSHQEHPLACSCTPEKA